VEGLLPAAHLLVELTVPGEGEERRIRVAGVGDSWAVRWERLGLAVQRWGRAA
jgi:hypothetical protein